MKKIDFLATNFRIERDIKIEKNNKSNKIYKNINKIVTKNIGEKKRIQLYFY